MSKTACRTSFSSRILEKAREDKEIIVITSDSKGSAAIQNFEKELPNQFVEVGIAEQNAVTIAAGLSCLSKKPFVVGPASFYSMRAVEQIKVDVAYSKNNVKIIGISGGLSYGDLGATHHSLQDIAVMRAIPDIQIILPSDGRQTYAMVDELLENDCPAYVRFGRGEVNDIYDSKQKFEIGKAIELMSGKDIAIIACGQTVWFALQAAKLLEKEGIFATVLDIHTIKPIDREKILYVAKKCKCVMTVEEHSIYGGLGGAVAEILAQELPVHMKIIGIPDEIVPNGKFEEVFEYYGMDAIGLYNSAKYLIDNK